MILSGHTPLRNEFDVEHSNDAELLVADMELRSDEGTGERLLKHRVLQIHNERHKERDRRRQYVIDSSSLNLRASDHDSIAVTQSKKWGPCQPAWWVVI